MVFGLLRVVIRHYITRSFVCFLRCNLTLHKIRAVAFLVSLQLAVEKAASLVLSTGVMLGV